MSKKDALDLSSPIFITGIGTDVGKTIVSAILCQWLQANYWKPIQSGDSEGGDSKTLKKLVSHSSFEIFKEAYKFDAPLSPHAAAKLEGKKIEVDSIIPPKSKNTIIIEGAGGLLVPLNYRNETICDLIIHLKAQVIVVVKEYLGNINHTLLTISHLEKNNIKIAGFVFVGEELPHTWDIIKKTTGLPLLFRVPIFDELNRNTIVNFAQEIDEK
jgi:dethiobiotin synthetase